MILLLLFECMSKRNGACECMCTCAFQVLFLIFLGFCCVAFQAWNFHKINDDDNNNAFNVLESKTAFESSLTLQLRLTWYFSLRTFFFFSFSFSPSTSVNMMTVLVCSLDELMETNINKHVEYYFHPPFVFPPFLVSFPSFLLFIFPVHQEYLCVT